MATMQVEEFAGLAGPGAYPGVQTPRLVRQTAVTTSSTSAQTAAFGTNTRLVLVSIAEEHHIEVGGTSPTATTDNLLWPAGVWPFWVSPGEKIAARTP